jgi:hypothetical protein
MAKGEVRKGKWGILGDGFFAQLSADGDTPGPLYNNANIKLQQGMVELALLTVLLMITAALSMRAPAIIIWASQ